MRLTELKIEKRKDFSDSKSLGPFQIGLNFLYGERGAGKTGVCNLFRRMYSRGDSSAATDELFKLVANFSSSTQSFLVHSDNVTAQGGLPVIDDEVIRNVYSVNFRQSDLSSLRQTLERHFDVGVDNSALLQQEKARIDLQRANLQNQIRDFESELAALNSQLLEARSRNAVSSAELIDLEKQIQALTIQLGQFNPVQLQAEILSAEQELQRLRGIQQTTTVTHTTESNLPALYRVLDETETQARELRSVQANIQQHRIRLKDEMEQWKHLSMDQQVHPYHHTREILQHIERRIDNINANAGQWAEDQTTVDSRMVQRFLGETCETICEDLQSLCDELSNQYREIRQRSAAIELKQLRHNYNQIEEASHRALARRAQAIEKIRSVDPQGAAAAEKPTNDFARIAVNEGNLSARQRTLGPTPNTTRQTVTTNESTTLRQQQIQALEARLFSLRNNLANGQNGIGTTNQQIIELRARKESLTLSLASLPMNAESRVAEINQQLTMLRGQLATLQPIVVPPPRTSPIFPAASEILKTITGGDIVSVKINAGQRSFEIENQSGIVQTVESIPEKGMQDIVQLAIVLAVAQTHPTAPVLPLVFDDLFVAIQKSRIAPVLSFLNTWCQQYQRQLIVLTQHRFLADQSAASTFFDLESGTTQQPTQQSSSWQAVNRQTVPMIDAVVPTTVTMSQTFVAEPTTTQPAIQPVAPIVSRPVPPVIIEPRQRIVPEPMSTEVDPWAHESIAEYPTHPQPRPYPLSKYPRTDHDSDDWSAIGRTESRHTTGSIGTRPIPQSTNPRVESIAASDMAAPLAIVSLDENSRIDGTGIFNPDQLRSLEEFGIISVADFLAMSETENDPMLTQSYLTGESLAGLQAAAWLMMWVPGLTANDSRALVACGISEPAHLLTSNPDSLFERLSRFLRSPDGRQFSSRQSPSRKTVSRWQQQLRSNSNYRNQLRRDYRVDSNRRNRRDHSTDADSSRDRSSYDRTSNERSSREYTTRERTPRDRSSREHTPRERTPREHTSHDRSSQEHTSRSRSSHNLRAFTPREQEGQSSNRSFPRAGESRRNQTPRAERTRTSERREYTPRAERERENQRSVRKPQAVRQTPVRQQFSQPQPSQPLHSASLTAEATSATPSKPAKQRKLKFYLDLTDHIEAAPSIGPKTGERMEAIGVHTISDFLKFTAESMAEKLDYKRLTASVLRQWQHQSRLVCRIPNLRGHDAQLLVGCDIIDAELLASMRPETLFEKIGPFSDTKEGLKIIRNGKRPDLEEITDWIEFAQHNRSLQAA